MVDNTEWEPIKDEKKDQDPNYFWNPAKKPEQPRTCEGEVLEIKDGKFGKVAVIETAEGKRETPGQKGLTPKIEQLKVGQYTKITWTGQKSMGAGKNDMLTYDVAIKKNYTPKPRAPEAPKEGDHAAIIAGIIEELKEGQKFLKSPVPEQNAIQTVKKHMMTSDDGKAKEFLATLKTKGLLMQNEVGYLVI